MASASGSMPKIIAAVVMTIGRSRIRPASRIAVRRSLPSPRAWFTKSISRMPFFVTRPMSMMMPIMDMTLIVPLVHHRASDTPSSESGSENMMANGCRNEPKSEARIR